MSRAGMVRHMRNRFLVAVVLRDGEPVEFPTDQVVVGDRSSALVAVNALTLIWLKFSS